MRIGSREFDVKRHTYVAGILNVTPDSFSDGGKYDAPDRAMEHVERMLAEGADMIDVGGESTRPGYQPVSVKEEMGRVLPVIKKIKSCYDVPVSLDTWKPEVARAALAEGADMINDISCMKDAKMAELIAGSGCAYCLMHNRDGFWEEECCGGYDWPGKKVREELGAVLESAWQAGIRKDQVIVDPGIGFAKSYEQNLAVLNGIEELHRFHLPILIGVSRKSVIGNALDLPVEERLEGTLAVTAYAVLKGCAFVRVHDVKENVRVIKMIESILNISDGPAGR